MSKLTITAKIYTVKDGKTATKAYASVCFNNSMFINSFVVSNTADNPEKLSVFPPSYCSKGKYHPIVEFPNMKSNRLYGAIRIACLSAYKIYSDTGRLHVDSEPFEVEYDTSPTSTSGPPKNQTEYGDDNLPTNEEVDSFNVDDPSFPFS